MEQKELLQLLATTLRMLALAQIQKANSGHPGIALGAADIMAVLAKHVNIHPELPNWPNRDRFVMSAGHGSALLYAWLHLKGFLTMDDLKQFRQLGSRTPGHPEYRVTPGVETSTGPLGQGIANAVGLALAEKMMAAKFNRANLPIVNHWTYVLCGDGDLMEGVSYEACSLAGRFELGKLILLYDSNRITIEGSTEFNFTENVVVRFKSQGWIIQVISGHCLEDINSAIEIAKTNRFAPNLIICNTSIGKHCPGANNCQVHGAPLSAEDFQKTKNNLRWDAPEFFVPETVGEFFCEINQKIFETARIWDRQLEGYKTSFPGDYWSWSRILSGKLPKALVKKLRGYNPAKPMATRQNSGEVIQIIANHLSEFVGGSADLGPSNQTNINNSKIVGIDDFTSRNISFGVREHAMGAILNGIALHGGFRPFGGTFLVFSDYMRPAIRMAAMMGLPVIYVFTHDSFYVGEDGPTHQPVEQLASLRSIPGLTVFRPADGPETARAWLWALENKIGPTALVLSRQTLPLINRGKFPVALKDGAYIVYKKQPKADVLIWATGSEVSLAIAVAEKLAERGVSSKVISAPSLCLFDRRRKFFPRGKYRLKVVIEAGSSQGWHKYAGQDALIFSLDQFGESAPAKDLAKKLGFTPEEITETIYGN